MKKIFAPILFIALIFTLMGCDISIERSGNKVFIGMSRATVYDYAKKAQQNFGLKIISEDKNRYTLNTQVVSSSALPKYGSAFVDLIVSESNQNAVITVTAKVSGDYDEKKSEQAAQEIVNRLVNFLNAFGSGLKK